MHGRRTLARSARKRPYQDRSLQQVLSMRGIGKGIGQVHPRLVESLVLSVLPEEAAGHIVHFSLECNVRG